MNSLRVWLYKSVPKSWRTKLGKNSALKSLRNQFLRTSKGYREAKVQVKRSYGNEDVSFVFHASIQVTSKAVHKGIENSLLNRSIELVQKHFPKQNDGCTVIDIGANFGYLSLVWSQTIAKNGHLYSFEPHERIQESFKKSIEANLLSDHITQVNCALGNEMKDITLHKANTSSNVLDALADEVDKTIVPMITLDHYTNLEQITSCQLIKVDVDGIELDILKGAEKTLRTQQPIVVVETNGEIEIIHFMQSLDYEVFDMKLNRYVAGDPLPWNAFFVPKALC